MSVLRDTSATIDLISRKHITNQMLLGETAWVKQPLYLHSTCLLLAQIELEGTHCEKIIIKAVVTSEDLDQGYYLLGNRTAELIAVRVRHPQLIKQVKTRSQTKK